MSFLLPLTPLLKFAELQIILSKLILPGGAWLGPSNTTCSSAPAREQRFRGGPRTTPAHAWLGCSRGRAICVYTCVGLCRQIPDEHFDGSFKPEMNWSISHANPWKLGAFVQ